MIGDPVIIKEIHKLKAKKVIDKIKPGYVVTISGPSGVGKSEVGTYLCNLLENKKLTSFLISVDDYYKTSWKERNIIRKKRGIDSVGLNEINWTQLRYLVESFKTKSPLRFQRIHRYAATVEYNHIDSTYIDILIIEGLYACYLKKWDLTDLDVFLEATTKQTYEFRKERKKENPDNEFRQLVVEKEARVVGQLRKYADIIIPFEV